MKAIIALQCIGVINQSAQVPSQSSGAIPPEGVRQSTQPSPVRSPSTQPIPASAPVIPPLYADNPIYRPNPHFDEGAGDPMLFGEVDDFDLIYRASRESNMLPFTVKDDAGFEYEIHRGGRHWEERQLIGTVTKDGIWKENILSITRHPAEDGKPKGLTIETISNVGDPVLTARGVRTLEWTSNTRLFRSADLARYRIPPTQSFLDVQKRIGRVLRGEVVSRRLGASAAAVFVLHKFPFIDPTGKQRVSTAKIYVKRDGSGKVYIWRDHGPTLPLQRINHGWSVTASYGQGGQGSSDLKITFNTKSGIRDIFLNPRSIMAIYDGIR